MKAEKRFETYCPYCDEPVAATLETRDEILSVKGEPTRYEATVAVCPICGEAIGDSRIESDNLKAAYATYAEAHGVMSPDAIRSLRVSYGLSVRDFSRFLGFGEQTVARYESGSLPDESHNTTLKLAATAHGATSLLDVRRESLTPGIVSSVESFIERESEAPCPAGLRDRQWPSIDMMQPSAWNGYRGFDWERIGEVIRELSERCKDLYRTKLQKAMFFVDYVCFERTSRSMTGLAYAHADYGPVMDGQESVVSSLVTLGLIELEPRGWGEVVKPLRDRGNSLTEEEFALVDEVAEFVDTFDTATDISDFSHKLDAWIQTPSGSIIGYPRYAGQVERAVSDRLAEARAS